MAALAGRGVVQKVVACLFSPVILGERTPLFQSFYCSNTRDDCSQLKYIEVQSKALALEPGSVEFLMSSVRAGEVCGN